MNISPAQERQLIAAGATVTPCRPPSARAYAAASGVTEAEFTAAVIEYAQRLGWYVYHARPGRTINGWRTPVQGDGAGFPDLVLVRERVVWVELKTDKGVLRKSQKEWRDNLTRAGGEWYCFRPGEWLEIEQAFT